MFPSTRNLAAMALNSYLCKQTEWEFKKTTGWDLIQHLEEHGFKIEENKKQIRRDNTKTDTKE